MKCPRCGENSYIEISNELGGIRQCHECGYATSRLHDDEVEQVCRHLIFFSEEQLALIKWNLETEELRRRELTISKLLFVPIFNGRSGDRVAVQQDKLYIKYNTDNFVEIPLRLKKLIRILDKFVEVPMGMYSTDGIEVTCHEKTDGCDIATVELLTKPPTDAPAPIMSLKGLLYVANRTMVGQTT